MKLRIAISAFGPLLFFACSAANAEALPRNGEFTGYLFTDRWGQDVFDYFYVAPDVARQLKPASDSWEPIRLSCSSIRQPVNPGGAMIHGIDKFTRVGSPGLKLTLKIEDDTIGLDDRLTAQVIVENESDKPVELIRNGIVLRITMASRSMSPNGKEDQVFRSHRNQYGFGSFAHKRIRVTADERISFFPKIPSGESRSFSHVVKTALLANEYELQAYYRPKEGTFPVPYVLSPLVSLDVVGKVGKGIDESRLNPDDNSRVSQTNP